MLSTQTPYCYIEAGVRGITERAIIKAREGNVSEMYQEIGNIKLFLETILQKANHNQLKNGD